MKVPTTQGQLIVTENQDVDVVVGACLTSNVEIDRPTTGDLPRARCAIEERDDLGRHHRLPPPQGGRHPDGHGASRPWSSHFRRYSPSYRDPVPVGDPAPARSE